MSDEFRLSDEDHRALVMVFNSLDKDGDAKLSRAELAKVLHQQLKVRFEILRDDADKRDKCIDWLLKNADTDADGYISLEEFVQGFYKQEDLLPMDYVEERAAQLARRLTKEDVEALKQMFAKIDGDGDGYISIEELDNLVGNDLFPEPEHAELRQEVIRAVGLASDVNGDGRLNLTEFIRSFARQEGAAELLQMGMQAREMREVCAQLEQELERDTLRKLVRMFEHLDKDGKQYLTRDDLAKLMHRLLKERVPDLNQNAELRNQLIDQIISAADTNKDGQISLEEFIQSFFDGTGVLPMDYVQEQADKVAKRLSKEEVAALKDMFASIDKDKDGEITVKEFEDLLAELLPMEDPEQRRQLSLMIIAASDKNSDGTINLTEFIRSFVQDHGIGEIVPIVAEKRAADEECAAANAAAEKQQVAAATKPETPDTPASPIRNDVSGVSFTDAQLAREFKRFDKNGNGFISRKEFKEAYMKMEWCGLEPTEHQVDKLLDQFSGGDDRLIYEEFCVLMLYRARM